VASTAREPAPPSAARRLAWALCFLSVALAVASVALALFNGENLPELVAYHHAIGILNALVLAPIEALIVVGDRRHLLAWLLLVDSLALATFNFTEQYAPLALGLTPRQLSLPGGDLASWLASWTNLPGIVISVVFLVLLFPDGRLPTRRWWPLGLAGAVVAVVPTAILAARTWPLRGPGLVNYEGEGPPLVAAMFETAFQAALAVGAVSVVALVLRFRRAGAVQRQQIKWFAYGAAFSIPLGLFPEAEPWGPYLELLGAALQLAGLGIGIFRFRLWDIDRLVNRTLVYGLLTVLLSAVYAGLVLALGQLSGGGGRAPSWAVAGATLAVAALFQPARRRVQQASTGASTGASTTRPGPSSCSARASATRWTWTRCRPSSWRRSTRRCGRRRCRCGCARRLPTGPLANGARSGSAGGHEPGPVCGSAGPAGSLRGLDLRRRHGGRRAPGGGSGGRDGRRTQLRPGHRRGRRAGAVDGRGRPRLDGGRPAQRRLPAGPGYPGRPGGGRAAPPAGGECPLPVAGRAGAGRAGDAAAAGRAQAVDGAGDAGPGG